MGAVTHSSRCSGCGQPLVLDHLGSCPSCGDTRKTHEVSIHVAAKGRASLGWRHVREYYKKHTLLLSLVIGITIGAPFLGLVLAGWDGVVVGVIVGVGTFLLGLCAVTKIREIREGHEP